MRFVLLIVVSFVLFALCAAAPKHKAQPAFRPFNALGRIHPDCTHGVPDGSHIINYGRGKEKHVRLPDGTVKVLPPCKHGFLPEPEYVSGSGWQVYAYYNGSNQLTMYTGNWVVPPNPASNGGQILYSFNGLQNSFSGAGPDIDIDIIQPVLQYGTTPAGGGNYWAMASWYVAEDGTALFSTVLKVKVADMIYGIMEMTSPDHWFISGNDTNSGKSTSLSVSKPNTKFEPWAFVTLEVYEVTNCDQYPANGKIPYTNLAITSKSGPETPNWTTGTQQKICKESISVESPTAVTISF